MSEKPEGAPTPVDFFSWLNQMMLPMSGANASKTNNPMAMWQDMAQKNQEAFTKFWQQMSGGPGMAQSMSSAGPAMNTYRAMLKQAAKAYLEAADMPTRDDVIRLGEQISVFSMKLDDMGEDLNQNLATLPNVLGQIAATLENLSSRLERLEARLDSQNQ